jgi:hypothetical protein
MSRALTGVSGQIGTPKKLADQRRGAAARLGSSQRPYSPDETMRDQHGSGAETHGQAEPRAALRALSD